MDNGKTAKFSISDTKTGIQKLQLAKVYDALKAKGYNPAEQIVGFLLTEDPAYITAYNDARNIMCSIDRYELLLNMFNEYLQIK